MINYSGLLNIAISASIEAGQRTLKYYHGEFDVSYKADNSPLTAADLESDKIILEQLSTTKIPILSEESKSMPYDKRKNWNRFWLVDPLDGTKEFINKSEEYTINIALIENGLPVIGVVFAPVTGIIYFASREEGSFKTIISLGMSIVKIRMQAFKLKPGILPEKLRVIASRSHRTKDTEIFIQKLNSYIPVGEINSYGSSLKLCMVAEGSSEIYPRLGPTMEWDTAAGHAVAQFANCSVIDIQRKEYLCYNKENMLNSHFVVCHPSLEKLVRTIIGQ
jgi:3'(2'), 5'-bisphosphate nucleotidase